MARNCSTPDDADQANSLFVETFINAQSPPNRTNFRREYLRLILSWGTEKFKSRLVALTTTKRVQPLLVGDTLLGAKLIT